jgi:GTP-binding protein
VPKPVVAIVGRPNVGKSTLFNRIAGGRVAIVEKEPGVTRDRLYQDAEWSGVPFTLVDTGGLDFREDDGIVAGMRQQAEAAIREADLLLFVVDARTGLTPVDLEIAGVLRRAKKPVVLVANKVEKYDATPQTYDFFRLGLGEPVPVSAAEGLNTGDLLDLVLRLLPPEGEAGEYSDDTVKIAVVGRPNVGKSSLVNHILDEERTIVSNIPGTTRDAVDSFFEREGRRYMIIDTAGIRRKSRIVQQIEKYGVMRSLKAIERSDVAVLLLDAVEGVVEQDKRIAGYINDSGKAIILVVNKWDLVEKDERTMARYLSVISREMAFVQYAPVVFTSALTGQRVAKVLEKVDFVFEQYTKRITTGNLNDLFLEAVAQNPPPSYKTRRLKIYYATQSGVKPPAFILFVNDTGLMHFSYARYLENQLRQAYGFEGTPIRLILRERTKERVKGSLP